MQPTIIGALVCICGLFSTSRTAITWQVLFCLLGGAAALTLPAVGGASVTPPSAFLPFLVVAALRDSRRDGRAYITHVPISGLYLAGAVLWGAACAMILPRLFRGELQILNVDRYSDSGGAAVLMPLGPVSGNITQSAYALGAVACFLAMKRLLAPPGRLEILQKAIILLSLLNCLSAAINLAQFHLGLPDILSYVRTGSYAQFGAYEAHGTGLMRIAGTFPEASTFAYFTLPLFAFNSTAWYVGGRRKLTGFLAATSLCLLLVSTSSTAYAGLGAYLAILGLSLVWKLYASKRLPYLLPLAVLVTLTVSIVGAAFVFETKVAKQAIQIFNVSLANKLESESGIERSQWNAQAWENFLETYGLGLGIGSARASSFALVLLSNLGLVGTICYLGFVSRTLTLERGKARGPIQLACRNAFLAALIAACVSAAVFDLGALVYTFAAGATCVRLGERSYANRTALSGYPVAAQ